MSCTKRKPVSQEVHVSGETASPRVLKKLKTLRSRDADLEYHDAVAAADISSSDVEEEHFSATPPAYDPADDSENDYEPAIADDDASEAELEEHSDGENQDLAPTHIPRKKKRDEQTVADSKVAKEKLHAEQIDFVMRTRDNNKPDPYGTHSTTTGKLEFPEVAKLYNAKFSLDVGPAAMEKRYRLNKTKYYQLHPTYPQTILYVKKVKAPPKPKAKKPPKKKVDEAAQLEADPDDSATPTATHAKQLQDQALDAAVRNEQKQKKKPRAPRKPYRPPQELIEAADLTNYIASSWVIGADEQPEFVTIKVVDVYERPLGTVVVPSKCLADSSAFFAEQRKQAIVHEMQIATPSLAIVSRFAQCISPMRLLALPEYDYAITEFTEENGAIEFRPTCTPIDWNFQALVQLYDIATEMRSDLVRDLILDHWRHQLQQKGELVLDPVELTGLFSKTSSNDPARQLWAMALHAYGVAPQILNEEGWVPALVEKLKSLAEQRVTSRPWSWNSKDFCRAFHWHLGVADCHRIQSSKPMDDEAYYQAIASRLLIEHGWSPKTALSTQSAIARGLRDGYTALQPL